MARLTEKQARFVAEYLVDLNATEAAKRAGYSEKTAYSIGFENLRKPEIQEAVQEKVGEQAEVVLVKGEQPVYYFVISVE